MKKVAKARLSPPTDAEKETCVYDEAGIKVFPHHLTQNILSCPQHAVFRILDPKSGYKTYVTISANESVSPFQSTWQKVWNDFLAYAKAKKFTTDKLDLMAYFKVGPRRYDYPQTMGGKLAQFVQEVRPLTPSEKFFSDMAAVAPSDDGLLDEGPDSLMS
jgi:hypothetical protein